MNQSRATKYVAYSATAMLMVVLAIVVLFAACFVLETEKKVAIGSTVTILAICVTPHFHRRLREQCSMFFSVRDSIYHFSWCINILRLCTEICLIGIFAPFGGLCRISGSFLRLPSGKHFYYAVAVLCGAISLLSLLHLDAASGGLFADGIMGIFQNWTKGGYMMVTDGATHYGYNTAAGRLFGLFGNANSMATMCAIGIFLALYLLLRAKGYWRILPCAALLLNAVTFIMCISFGATLSLGLTILLLIVCLPDAKARLSFAVITLETLLVSAVVAILNFPHMGTQGSGGYLVLLYCVAGCLALFGLDFALRQKAVDILSKKN